MWMEWWRGSYEKYGRLKQLKQMIEFIIYFPQSMIPLKNCHHLEVYVFMGQVFPFTEGDFQWNLFLGTSSRIAPEDMLLFGVCVRDTIYFRQVFFLI